MRGSAETTAPTSGIVTISVENHRDGTAFATIITALLPWNRTMDNDSGRGLRFTQSRAEQLIPAVATPGEWFSKADVTDLIVEKHRNDGGVFPGNVDDAIRKGLQRLAKTGMLKHNGMRSRASQYMVPLEEAPRPVPSPDIPQAVAKAVALPEERDLPTGDRVVGSPESGHGYIYVICDTTHEPEKSNAVVKLGKSDRLTNQRVVAASERRRSRD